MSEIDSTSKQSGKKAGIRAAIAISIFVVIGFLLWLAGPADRYLWLKALHVIAIISWMAGLVYLPRLFVYHSYAEKGSVQSETFKVMERRLMKIIMTPAMIIAWVLGLWLAYSAGYFTAPWFHMKLLAVVLLSGVHSFYAGAVKKFAADMNDKTARQWRMYNEIPTVLMIFIVIMVIVKPF